jgi:hypothetical protein
MRRSSALTGGASSASWGLGDSLNTLAGRFVKTVHLPVRVGIYLVASRWRLPYKVEGMDLQSPNEGRGRTGRKGVARWQRRR